MRPNYSKNGPACSADAPETDPSGIGDLSKGAADDKVPTDTKPANGERQGTYKPEFARVAKRMRILGATDADLANAFDVTISAITKWRVDNKEFFESCRAGEEFANERVRASLYQRAVGYEYEAEVVFHYQGRPIVAKYRKHVLADTSAAMFWLVNRMPDEWSYDPKPEPVPKHETALDAALRAAQGTRFWPKA